MARRARLSGDSGSAVVGFVLVSGLVVLLFLGLMQVAVLLHVRATTIDCAAEGARLAARANGTLVDGEQRARDLVAESLAPDYAQEVTARQVDLGGVSLVEVTIKARVPLVGLWGPSGGLTVVGRAVAEDRQ